MSKYPTTEFFSCEKKQLATYYYYTHIKQAHLSKTLIKIELACWFRLAIIRITSTLNTRVIETIKKPNCICFSSGSLTKQILQNVLPLYSNLHRSTRCPYSLLQNYNCFHESTIAFHLRPLPAAFRKSIHLFVLRAP